MAKSLKSKYTNPSAAAAGAVNLSAPNLASYPPRSPRVRLGGYVHLPRLIDKARAAVAGRNGDYHYNCPLDQRFFSFTGVDPKAFLAQVKAGKSDGELLAYVEAKSKPKRHPAEIAAWSAWFEHLTPTDPEVRGFFNQVHQKNAPHREDIGTWFDWLDLDDYATFGGRP